MGNKQTIRDAFVTGSFSINHLGEKEPSDWKEYALRLERYISESRQPEEPKGRKYDRPLDQDDEEYTYTVSDWDEMVAKGRFNNSDGEGFWVKDGMISGDEVFSTRQLDATHVVWYNN